jgi:hypothetical protein
MSLVNQNIIAGAGAQNAYQISRSVRLRSSATAFFSRTPASAGNRRTWTWSGWVKRGALGGNQQLFLAGTGGSNRTFLGFESSNRLAFYSAETTGQAEYFSVAVFRDPSAWYHVVISLDTTQSVAANRFQLWVNGVLQSLTTLVTVAQNYQPYINNNQTHVIGYENWTPANYFDGYLTEVNFIDGQALTPSAFGETDAITGVWKPKRYTGTYGTNGFFLNFSDPSAATAAAIGRDYSGNGNNWTPNNISVTAGVTYDSMLDVPTPWADGGNGRGNYAVLNPLDQNLVTATQGNLYLTCGASASATVAASIGMSSGKWYAEFTPDGAQALNNMIGVCNLAAAASNRAYSTANGWYYWGNTGQKYNNNIATTYGASYTAGDVIGVAFDADAGTLAFFKNGVSQGTAFTGLTGAVYAFAVNSATSSAGVASFANFGQRPFAYTPPTGFRALNTQNLPEPNIVRGNRFMDVSLYSGNSSSQTVTNAGGFQPDLVWIKSRNVSGNNHNLWDSARGAGQALFSNLTNAESTSANMTGFTSSGFSFSGVAFDSNTTGNNLVAWQWREGATQGFDIVTYTGTGANRTVAHSLGVAPRMMIVKPRQAVSGAGDWQVYHASANASPASGLLQLNTTIAFTTASTVWNNTAPTSSVFSLGTSTGVNNSGTDFVAYLFSEVAGFSRFGSYTGNGSTDGPFVFCGFRPRWVMIKRTDAASVNGWYVWDTARNPANTANLRLYPNSSSAEVAGNTNEVDVLSGGFKLRFDGSDFNANGGTYIYAAFAENPFKYSLAR